MKTIKKTTDTKVLLSTLWIVIMINMLKADIFSLYIPGIHEEMAEFLGETPVTQMMLFAAIITEISIAMIFLSRVLKYKANRWANIIAGVITIVWVVGGGSTYPHYIFIATIEVVCSLLIIWFAWRWREQEA